MNQPPSLDRVRAIVSTILDVPAESLAPESSPETVAEWTSLRHLVLALELEQEFGISLSPEDMERLVSVSAIVGLLEERQRVSAP